MQTLLWTMRWTGGRVVLVLDMFSSILRVQQLGLFQSTRDVSDATTIERKIIQSKNIFSSHAQVLLGYSFYKNAVGGHLESNPLR